MATIIPNALDAVPSLSRLRMPMRAAAIIGVCFWQAACSTGSNIAIPDADDANTRAVISQTIELVATRYIDPISREQIVVNTLDGLSELDPDVQVGITPDDLILSYRGETVQRLSLPDSDTLQDDGLVWSEFTLKGLGAIRTHSPVIRHAATLDLQSAMVKGSIRNLDRYSRYEGPRQAETARNRRDGYIGIGVRLVGGTGYPVIKKIHANSPAVDAGLNPGDQIVSIDGQDMYGKTASHAAERLHGAEGSRVAIEVNAANTSVITPVEIVRRRVIDQTVFSTFNDNILIARISRFNSATATELGDSLLKAQLYPGGLRGVVLDLRGNRGGLLQQGVAVADLFLPGGPIGNTKSRVMAARHVFKAESRDVTEGAPLVVLIDGRTASSAELVAAALQDRNRAVLVGATSFGKGSVQAINDLSNDGTLTFTWSRITAPSGYTFDRIGLFPAVCTATHAGTTPAQQVSTALMRRNKTAQVMARWKAIDFRDETTRRELRAVCPSLTHSDEYDVKVALELIKNHPDYMELAFIGQQEVADTFAAH